MKKICQPVAVLLCCLYTDSSLLLWAMLQMNEQDCMAILDLQEF